MQKLHLFLLLLLLPALSFAQQRTKIVLQSSSSLIADAKTGLYYVKNPVFRQDNATLTCDSAVFYKDRNYFEAFRNVHINQGDTVNIFSDFLDYDGNKKHAHLSSNVRMVDPTSVLTTNVLDYDMAPKIGTYINGGKIVNKEVTLTSKKGWYFANSKDAYFRYDVLVVTPQSTIKSDTLRYNTLSNWTYFYGPTNIKGKDDNLYTENGAYNTKNENAYFGKKNLYTQGTKSLKGDSLYYYGRQGYGKAVKNIIFMDTQDKLLLRGQLGEYYKADERVVVTRNAYFGMGTKDSVMVKTKKMPDTLWLGADTLEAQMVLQKSLALLSKPLVQKNNEITSEDAKEKEAKELEKAAIRKQAKETSVSGAPSTPKNTPKKLTKKEKKLAEQKAEEEKNNPPPPSTNLDSLKLKADSLKTDSLQKRTVIAAQSGGKKDSLAIMQKTATKGKVSKNTVLAGVAGGKGNAKMIAKKDSVVAFNPADTVRTRVIKAFHNVRVFKSNMQAKADSLFYTAADSTLRWYKNPILWSEGSQQTGDTIHVFFKNDKIHSFQVLQNGFIVNVEGDSTKFNQVKGRKITGFFNNGEMRNIYVDGNAESMYYNKDDKGNYDNLSQSVSSRINFRFMNKELTEVVTIKGNEGAVYPIDKLPKETTLTGFIWKPELRPISKADIIAGNSTKGGKIIPKSKTANQKPIVGTKTAAPPKKMEAKAPLKVLPATNPAADNKSVKKTNK